MADKFHRLVAPTYFTGGPTFPSEAGVTYDYINNGGSGTPSFADGAKVGTVNAGTYFYAFGEDATSLNFNRGNKALSENSDHLDNLLHRSIATTIRTADVTPGAPVANITLPISTFLGTAGYTTSTADLKRLFHVVDTSDNEIDVAGAIVTVTSVTLGGGDVINGSGGNGSFSGNTVQINLTPSIPTSQAYRVYYGTRSNLATLPLDGLTNIIIRGAEEVEGVVEELFRQLHGNNESWNAAWTTTIFDLGVGGLNERYNRASATPITAGPDPYFLSADLDVIGSGGWISRTGPALTVYANNTGAYTDPLNALFMAKFYDHTAANSGGAVGFGVYGSRQTGTAWTGETLNRTPGAAAFMQLWPHYFQSSIHASNPLTRIVDGAAANLSMVGGFNANTGEAIVQVTTAGNYFRTGGSATAIAIGYDLLELTYTVGGTVNRRLVVIVCHGATTDLTNVAKVRVRNLDGTVPDFSTNPTATIRWVSATFMVADGAAAYHNQLFTDVSPVRHSGFFYQVPPSLSAVGGDDNVPRSAPAFSAKAITNTDSALQWGGFTPLSDLFGSPAISGPQFQGFLRGDGSLDALEVRAYGSLSTQGALIGNYVLMIQETISNFVGVGTANLDMAVGSFKKLTADTTGGGFTVTLNITHVRAGGEYVIYMDHSAGANNLALTWAGAGLTHRFGSGDASPAPGAGRELWVGRAISATELVWTVTRY